MKLSDLLSVLIGDYVVVNADSGELVTPAKASNFTVVSVETGRMYDYIIHVEVV